MPGLGDLDLGLPRLPSLNLGQGSPFHASLSGEQRESFGRNLLERGKSGLSAVLDTLQMPGDYLRGGLTGKLGQRVTGQQMLQKMGAIRPGDRGWGAWGLGLAADIVTDPFTYATFGAKHALTSGGRALHRIGELQGWNRKALLEGYHGLESARLAAGDSSGLIAHLRDSGQRLATPAAESAYQAATGKALRPGSQLTGLARASIPFFPDLGVTVGSGKLAQGIGAGLDTAGDFLKYGNPLGRAIGSAFDWRVGRAVDANTQRAKAATAHYQKQLESTARLHENDTWKVLDDMIRGHPEHEADILRAARISTEGTSPLAFLGSTQDPAKRALFQDFLNRTKNLGDTVAGYGTGQLKEAHELGLKLSAHGDKWARYMSRQSNAAREAGVGAQFERRTIFPAGSGANVHRKDWTRNIPGGTDRINDWVSRFAGNRDRTLVSNGIFGDLVDDHAFLRGGAPPDPLEMIAYDKQAKEIASAIGALSGEDYLGAIRTSPFFSHDLPGDVARRGSQHARTMASARAITQALAQGAKGVNELGASEFITLPRALKELQLANHYVGNELIGAGKNLYRGLAPKGAGMVDPLVSGGMPFGLHGELKQWGIPTAEFEKIRKSYGNWILPEEMKAPIKGLDSFTNAFKALTYPLFVASHVRNAATAALHNLRTGTTAGDYWKQFKLMRGELPRAEADSLRRSQYGHARIFGEGGPNLELAGQNSGAAMPSDRNWLGYAPGTNQYGQGKMGPTGSLIGDTANLLFNEGGAQLGRDVVAKARDWKNAPNPFGISGVAGRDRDVLAPLVAGRKVGTNIEDFFRGAQYQGLIRQGYSPEMAAEQIRKYHFDYRDLAPFERNVMKRVAPFYTFARKNLPLQLETIATRPGAFSTPFKPSQVNRDRQDYVPDYLSTGFAMPMGAEHDGKRRFLTSLGLPQEEAFKEMSLWNGAPDITGTMMRYAGNLNPLIKGPLEQLAGKQFFSGRNLEDLRPTAAGAGLASLFTEEARNLNNPLAQLFTQGISNTPLTRFGTVLDKIVDTKGLGNPLARKEWPATALNLLTGARISDVDIERQRYLEMRNAEQRILRSMPHVRQYANPYVPPELKDQVTPEEALNLRMMVDLQQRGKEYLKRQRALGIQP